MRPKGRRDYIVGLAQQSVRIQLRLWSLQVLDSNLERAFRQAMLLCLWVCGMGGWGGGGVRVEIKKRKEKGDIGLVENDAQIDTNLLKSI